MLTFRISIHALREEGDFVAFAVRPARLVFLSTPSARRATEFAVNVVRDPDISIHALREEGDRSASDDLGQLVISIHALREEGDASVKASSQISNYFYPRPPRGGRRARLGRVRRRPAISIHALREEGDSKNRDKISIFKQIIQHSARI